jgi:O-antigen/teichoic acid export membrane protein
MAAVAEPASREEAEAGRMAGSVILLTGRRLVVAAATAVGGVAVARILGPGHYGGLASAQAISGLALAAVDFGFGAYLARELARRPDDGPRLLRATVQVQLVWALLVALVVAGIGLSIGLDVDRGAALVVLAPGIAFTGLNGFRQIFYVLYEVRRLVWVDVPANVLMVGAMIAAAALGGGPVGVAAAMSAGTIGTSIAVMLLSRHLVRQGPSDRTARREVVRISAPLGLTSFMASVYLLVDVVILGWLVSAQQLGLYAAAAKVLGFLLMIPALVATAALPGLSRETGDPVGLGLLVARVWHWLAAISLPVCVGIAVFPHAVAEAGFGHDYIGAVPYLRILTIASVFAIGNTVLGMLLVSHHLIRAQVVQNTVAITVNVVGNVVLVPHFGVVASAWLTVAAEAIVFLGALYSLRLLVDFDPTVRALLRPVAAVAVATLAVCAVVPFSEAAAIAVYALALLVAFVGLRAWPVELLPARMRPA